ncbi:DNA polymerase III subunit delta [Thorsellia anophelis]|uniref:DNA polymerase III subunit delta n=1 Tax=Thorsellia anophelis DSM 18579 TaxID=1123402 RepID=A0A1I0BR63_9GAMM|nr:DNA polymerase III subunit delta [Thorsellia anophelis]SET08773.1 DNA polymerase III, delta subunit [Thorsellia anophelis DSM 18579]
MRLYDNQLITSHLSQPEPKGKLRPKYLITGTELLLVEESAQAILSRAKTEGFSEHDSFNIEAKTDWNSIFSLCEGLSLFSDRRIISIQLPESSITASIGEKLIELSTLLHQDILLIIKLPKPTKALENSKWYKALFNDDTITVICVTPNRENLSTWVDRRAKNIGLKLELEAIHELCYHYEGNLLALSQMLNNLSLLFTDKLVTAINLKNILFDAAHFTPYHWIDALLLGKAKRSLHILQQLKKEEFEPIILIRTLQTELIQMIKMSSQLSQTDIRSIFDHFKIWQNRRNFYTEALKRLSFTQLSIALSSLAELEIQIKSDYSANIWSDLNDISLLICSKKPLHKTNLIIQ